MAGQLAAWLSRSFYALVNSCAANMLSSLKQSLAYAQRSLLISPAAGIMTASTVHFFVKEKDEAGILYPWRR